MQNYIKTLFNALRYWIEDKFNTIEVRNIFDYIETDTLILLSPNGTRFNITVGDDGVLSATKITE